MSRIETHFGKLRKVTFNEGCTIENWCKQKCQEKGINEIPSYHANWVEQFKDAYDEKYFIINDEIWEAFEHVENDEFSDINIMNLNEDGTITFVQQFYNGGTCLTEIIEQGIEKIQQRGNG